VSCVSFVSRFIIMTTFSWISLWQKDSGSALFHCAFQSPLRILRVSAQRRGTWPNTSVVSWIYRFPRWKVSFEKVYGRWMWSG
jgi:hypothetical protein